MQGLVQYVLTMDGSEGLVGTKVIYLLFGKMARNKFTEKGIFCRMPEEKRHLRAFVIEHLRQKDAQVRRANSIYRHDQICEALSQEVAGVFLHVYRSIRVRSLPALDGESAEPLKSQSRVDRNKARLRRILGKKDSIRGMLDSGVPTKYIDHLVWLAGNSQSAHPVESFEKLISDAYKLRLRKEPHRRSE